MIWGLLSLDVGPTYYGIACHPDSSSLWTKVFCPKINFSICLPCSQGFFFLFFLTTIKILVYFFPDYNWKDHFLTETEMLRLVYYFLTATEMSGLLYPQLKCLFTCMLSSSPLVWFFFAFLFVFLGSFWRVFLFFSVLSCASEKSKFGKQASKQARKQGSKEVSK